MVFWGGALGEYVFEWKGDMMRDISKEAVQPAKPLLKLPTTLIRFNAIANEDLARTLNRVFASLPDNVGIWLATGISRVGVSFAELSKDLAYVGIHEVDVYEDWAVWITRNSKRWVIHNPKTGEWIVCFPGGSTGAAKELYQTIVWRDDVEITEVR